MKKHPDITVNDAGMAIIKLLGLTVKSNGRVDTDWGDKTPAGLYATLSRFFDSPFESYVREYIEQQVKERDQ